MLKKLCAILLSANLIVCNLTVMYAEYNQHLSPPSLAEIQVDNEDLFKNEHITADTKHTPPKIIIDIILASSIGLVLLTLLAKIHVGVLPSTELILWLGGILFAEFIIIFTKYKRLKISNKIRVMISSITLPLIVYMLLTTAYFHKTFILADSPAARTTLVDQMRSLPKGMFSGITYIAVGRTGRSDNIGGLYFFGKDYPLLGMAMDRIVLSSVYDDPAQLQVRLIHELGHQGYRRLSGPVKDQLEKYHIDNNEDFSHLGKYAQYEVIGVEEIKSKQKLEELRDAKRLDKKAGIEAYCETVESWVHASELLFLYETAAESEALRYFIEHAAPNFIHVQNEKIFYRFYYPKFMNGNYFDVKIPNQSPSYEELREAYTSTLVRETGEDVLEMFKPLIIINKKDIEIQSNRALNKSL